ncbi:hypothetical protein ScPMuIL_008065 [Solemya velum]
MPEHSPSPTPERAIYGYVLYLAAYVFFGVYIVWAYIPGDWLNAIGLTYWPQKYWAVSFPVYGCVAFLLAYPIYFGIILLNTPPLDSINLITDSHAQPAGRKAVIADSIPPIADMDISDVNRQLYL